MHIMSYLIAFARLYSNFDKQHLTENSYPMKCNRSDLSPGEVVFISLNNQFFLGKIERLEFLNWNCKGKIICKESEGEYDNNLCIFFPPKEIVEIGLLDDKKFINELNNLGWIPLTRKTTYKVIFEYGYDDKCAYILLRKNGIDLQIISDMKYVPSSRYSEHQHSLSYGTVVRNYFAHTTENLYERILNFALDFSNEKDISKYLTSVGRSDKRTDNLIEKDRERKLLLKSERDTSWSDIYSGLGAENGESGYLGSGMWITSSEIDYYRSR